ncbi:protein-glutamate O-methyltransferase CheR [Proteobacteria bacterium 005FR1]|nr:protein-glutamate O-methyltransferase CheR [Proteobacteria bacterium 005FR1]
MTELSRPQEDGPPSVEEIELRLFIDAIRHRYEYDFRDYSMSSLRRRLTQACEHFDCRSFSMLQDKILHGPEHLEELLSFLTVQVSEMFRDPIYYKALREEVVPHLRTYPSLKVWVAGVATGEELYSLSILFREEGLGDRTIFYATDINPSALQKAQRGVFSLDRMQEYTRNYQASGGKASLSDYYASGYDRAIFDKGLRQNVVFSDHSLVTDSVFAEMQLISCRNVLIYFNGELQDRATKLFYDSLCPRGFLGLGSRETLRFSQQADMFKEVNPQARLYQKL